MVVSSKNKSALEAIRESKAFISSTIDEILGCLPNEPEEIKEGDFFEGFITCRNFFLQNLEEKASK